MSCGHDGCTCAPDQQNSDAHLPMAEGHPAVVDGHADQHGGGHGHDTDGDDGCCGGCAA